ncbi:MAG: LLM class flavin-dependent oxidoreductase [Haloarculaceae archaeon]
MDVGLGPLGDLPESRSTPAELTTEVVETAAAAEVLSFESVWLGERHFAHETVTASAPVTLAAAVAQATDAARIGTAVALLPLHDPVRLTEQVAVLDAISGGRVTVGGGIGYMQNEYDAFGVDADRRVAELLDAVEVLQAAADHEPLAYEGRVHEVEGVRIEPRYTQDPRPPVWLGGTVPQAMERAAAVADGYLGIPAGTDFYRGVAATLAEATEDPSFEVGAMVNAFVADTTEAALSAVEPGLAYLDRRYARWRDEDRPAEPDTSTGVYGTPAEVVEGLREYEAILGEDVHCLVRLHYPDVPRAASDRAMELFADEVLPEL